jgi:predicted nucleic acid-binding protein
VTFVLDASVALAWCFEDEGGAYALDVLESLRSTEAVVPTVWPLEVTNGLVVAERRGRINAPAAVRALSLLRALPVVVEPSERRRVFEGGFRLARTHGLSTYDAAYLELALTRGLPLATLDGPLADAAEAEGLGRFRPAPPG